MLCVSNADISPKECRQNILIYRWQMCSNAHATEFCWRGERLIHST
jgi:hypothetical protein